MLGSVLKDFFVAFRAKARTRHVQEPAAVAVALQTILRPSVKGAIESVFAQDINARVQLLIGIDKKIGNLAQLNKILSDRPSNIEVTVLDLGYSTSVRHGGVHSNHFGGALRTILSFAANSRYVAYLDDDDWYAPQHLSSMLAAIRGHEWAHSLRSFANPYNMETMCVDTVENLGPGKGVYANWGGFACPSSLMIDKRVCAPILHLWSEAGTPRGDAEDRVFFKALCDHFKSFGTNDMPTVNCVIKPEDSNHAIRERIIFESGYPIERLRMSSPHGFERS
jgi:hypothetical protein